MAIRPSFRGRRARLPSFPSFPSDPRDAWRELAERARRLRQTLLEEWARRVEETEVTLLPPRVRIRHRWPIPPRPPR